MLSFQFFSKFVDSTHIHVACKFARRYGKDCESEVHVNLAFRIRLIHCTAHAFDDFRKGERRSGYLLTFQDILHGTFNCLSVHIVSSGGIKICSRKIGKLNYLAYSVRSCAR